MGTSDVTSPCNESSTCSDLENTGSAVLETLMAVYLGAILLLSLAFNGILCLVFVKKPHLLSISNCFVLNLTCCHLCMSVFVLPFSLLAVVSQGSWIYGGPWCEFQGFFFTAIVVNMQFALLIISLDRNYAIMNSLRYPNVFTQTLCSFLIGGSWITASVLSIPPLLHSKAGEYKFHPHQFLCTLDWTSTSAYLIVFSILSFGMPVLFQSICYVKIFKAAIGHSKRSTRIYPISGQQSPSVCVDPPTLTTDYESGSATAQEYTSKRNTTVGCKAVRTIFILAITYSVCWVPYLIDCFLAYTCNIRLPNLSAASLCLVFSTGILNPIIYGYMNRVIRREIGRFLCGNPSVNDTEDFVSTSMSTFSSAKKSASSSVWVTQQSGGSGLHRNQTINSEMGTIIEEAEDNGTTATVAAKDEPKQQNMLPKKSIEETGNNLNVEKTTVHRPWSGKSIDLVNSGENLCVSDIESQKNIHRAEIENTDTITQAKISSPRETNIPENVTTSPNIGSKSDRRSGERRRSMGSRPDSYFSKSSRRKKRDCGSFLYLDGSDLHETERRFRSKEQKKRRHDRISIDHVQSISLSPVPKIFKLRLSFTGEKRPNDTLTLRSDVKIQGQDLPNANMDSNDDRRTCHTRETYSA